MPKLSTKGYTARSSGPRVMATPCSSGVPAGMLTASAPFSSPSRPSGCAPSAPASRCGGGSGTSYSPMCTGDVNAAPIAEGPLACAARAPMPPTLAPSSGRSVTPVRYAIPLLSRTLPPTSTACALPPISRSASSCPVNPLRTRTSSESAPISSVCSALSACEIASALLPSASFAARSSAKSFSAASLAARGVSGSAPRTRRVPRRPQRASRPVTRSTLRSTSAKHASEEMGRGKTDGTSSVTRPSRILPLATGSSIVPRSDTVISALPLIHCTSPCDSALTTSMPLSLTTQSTAMASDRGCSAPVSSALALCSAFAPPSAAVPPRPLGSGSEPASRR
mmetsp:Transcript_2498/g.7390  ORF Transcript_2498/g.7390 Transcript_2498/m.7390 type:complete len:338 (+) Transcript_2498:995-2008(+)